MNGIFFPKCLKKKDDDTSPSRRRFFFLWWWAGCVSFAFSLKLAYVCTGHDVTTRTTT